MKRDIFQSASLLLILFVLIFLVSQISREVTFLLVGLFVGVAISEIKYLRTKKIVQEAPIELPLAPPIENRVKKEKLPIVASVRIIGRND